MQPSAWYGYTINDKTAQKIQEVAWKITSSYPRSGVTAGPANGKPPSTPTNLTVSQITSAGVVLNWKASTDRDKGFVVYSVYQNKNKLPGFYFKSSALINNLDPSTTYTFTVKAANRVGVFSADSPAVSAKTLAPTVPVESLSLNPNAQSLNIACDRIVAPKFTPATADNQGVIWTSSDPTIATVDAKGVVAAKSSGTATITATARDHTTGIHSATATVTVLPNHPPTASFKVATAKGSNPLLIGFDGMASSDPDPRDGIFGWDWDFGDGSPHFYGANPNHAYSKEGTYTASLVVLDNNGASSEKVSQTITLPLPVLPPK